MDATRSYDPITGAERLDQVPLTPKSSEQFRTKGTDNTNYKTESWIDQKRLTFDYLQIFND